MKHADVHVHQDEWYVMNIMNYAMMYMFISLVYDLSFDMSWTMTHSFIMKRPVGYPLVNVGYGKSPGNENGDTHYVYGQRDTESRPKIPTYAN